MGLPSDHAGQIMAALQSNMYVSIDDIAWEDHDTLTALPHVAALPPGVKVRLRRELAKLKVIL